MKTVIHKADTRGSADHGWLKAKHTFSFASYMDQSRVHFGALRVLNDDIVAGGMGFGEHPHDNMEIVTIPLQGALRHRDSMGTNGVIEKNDVQIMSAGSGLRHSEMNASSKDLVNLLQIWVFPKERNIKPRYDQKTFSPEERKNAIITVVAPNLANALWINQDAWFSLGGLAENKIVNYPLFGTNTGVYVFVIAGSVVVNGVDLETRDGAGFSETTELEIKANHNSEFLLIEVPMDF